MSTKIRWNVYDDAEPDSFNVYRAITGVAITFPNSLATGDTFFFQATTRDVQKITVGADTTIDGILSLINDNAKGLKATKSDDGLKLFLRCTARENPKLKIQPCTFATNAGIASGIYTPRAAFELVANEPFVPSQATYEYEDVDGDTLDWYHITSLTGADESLPSVDMQPLIACPDLCVVEGRITDLQNSPIVGVRVDAAIQIPVGKVSNTGIVTPEVFTITDSYGRWSLPLLRNQLVLFQIEAIGYNEILSMPDAAFALFKDLKPVDEHLFSAGGDPT